MPAHLIRGSGAGRTVLAATLVLGAALAAAPAAAQDAPSENDLRALIYYSVNGQTDAAAAELRRLRSAFPGWTPPDAPAAASAAGPNASEINGVYGAIAAKRIAEAQTEIETLRRRYPSWSPPDDMTRLVDLELAQQAFSAAIDAGDVQTAQAVARSEVALRRCDRVNNVWRLAELQARLDQKDPALAAYRGVLAACTDYDVTVATLEKSAAVGDAAWLRDSFDIVEPKFPDRQDKLARLESRLLAGIGAPTAATAAPSSGTAAAPVPRTRAAESAPARRQTARRREPGTLPSRGDKRLRAVVRAAEARDWQGCLRASMTPRSLDVLYQRAWCLYSLDRPLQALPGFRAALGGGLDATATRDAAYGAALAYLSMSAVDDAAAIAAAHDMTRAQRVDVESGILDQRGVAAYKAGRYAEAIAYLDALEGLRGWLPRDLAMLRGYAYKNAGQFAKSQLAFKELHSGLASEQSAAALRSLAR